MSKIITNPLIVTGSTRVKTSDGAALATMDGVVLGNDLPNKWIKVPRGAIIRLLAAVTKTDSFIVAITFPAVQADPEAGVEARPAELKGVVLRLAGWENLLESAEIYEAPVPEVTPVLEVPEASEDKEVLEVKEAKPGRKAR